MSTEQEYEVRRYAFAVAIGAFLVSYLVTMLRTRSFEWAIFASSLVLVVMVGAGLFVTSFIRVTLTDSAERSPEAPTGPKGRAVDLTLQDDDRDEVA